MQDGMVTDEREVARQESDGRHDARRRGEPRLVRAEAVGGFAQRCRDQVRPAHQLVEIDVRPERLAPVRAAVRQEAVALDPRARGAAHADPPHVAVQRIEARHQADLLIALRHDGDGIRKRADVHIELGELLGERAVLALQPLAPRHVDRPGNHAEGNHQRGHRHDGPHAEGDLQESRVDRDRPAGAFTVRHNHHRPAALRHRPMVPFLRHESRRTLPPALCFEWLKNTRPAEMLSTAPAC